MIIKRKMDSVHPVELQEKSRRPKDNPFFQQTMKAYKPVPTVLSTLIIFSVVGISFITIGSVVFAYSSEITEKSVRYDDKDNCELTAWNSPQTCSVTLEIDEDIDETVYFYYQLHNYYQNHRRYVKSKSLQQLAGENLSKGELDDCEPVLTYEDLGFYDKMPSGYSLSDAAYPCGLIAKTVFNDTFTLQGPSGAIEIDENDIAWDSDKEKKFDQIDGKDPWIDVEDEHFIVWMRVAGLPDFRKLWGKIHGGMKKGTYTVNINSFYDVSGFEGEKHVVISTANEFGGKNNFLAIAYIVVGCISLVLAILFAVRGYMCKKPQDLHND